jgi:hypothetical protein
MVKKDTFKSIAELTPLKKIRRSSSQSSSRTYSLDYTHSLTYTYSINYT